MSRLWGTAEKLSTYQIRRLLKSFWTPVQKDLRSRCHCIRYFQGKEILAFYGAGSRGERVDPSWPAECDQCAIWKGSRCSGQSIWRYGRCIIPDQFKG